VTGAHDQSNAIVVELASPSHLFAASDDPFEEDYDVVTGMERIVEIASADPGRLGGRRLVLRLPGDAVTPGLEARLAAAIRRHCSAEAADLDRRRAVVRRDGLHTLGVAGLLIAACVGLSLAVEALVSLPPRLEYVVGAAIVIAGWVALWRPLDLLLYETWLKRREARLYRSVAAMPVAVTQAEEGVGG
jgi:hypothetical protein